MRWTVLLVAVLALGGCSGPAGSKAASPQAFKQENDFVSYVRTLPARVQPRQEFTVRVAVTAKQDLALLAVSEDVPTGLTVVQGETTSFQTGLSAGRTLELSYTLRAERAGTFELAGTVRAKPLDGTSQPLKLTSQVESR